jgi:hypothetical protein
VRFGFGIEFLDDGIGHLRSKVQLYAIVAFGQIALQPLCHSSVTQPSLALVE